MTVRRILVALIVVSSAFIAPAGAQTTTDYLGIRTSALGRAVRLAKTASLAQAVGISPTIELNVQRHSDPALEITELATRFGMQLTPLQLGQVASLRRLDGDLQAALADTIGAFTGFKIAASAGTFADVVAARGVLLDSVVRLEAFGGADVEHSGICAPLDLTPVLLLDVTGCDNVYDSDWVALSIDFGGDDVYRNNAGGVSTYDGRGAPTLRGPAAATIDLDGDDLYEQDWKPWYFVATNGSALFGSGFLLDAAGNDTYIGGNGSAVAHMDLGPFIIPTPSLRPVSSGFLMDVGGDDFYLGCNGCAAAFSHSFPAGVARALLFDAGGFDSYQSGSPRYPGETRTECTDAPKNSGPPNGDFDERGAAVGAQIDFPHTDCPT